MSRVKLLGALALCATLALHGCSTVVVRNSKGSDEGRKHSYTSRAYALGIYRSPFGILTLPANIVASGMGGGTGSINVLKDRDRVGEDYAFSEVCIESTIGDWFLRIVTLGFYWPSTVTVWIVD